MNTATWKSRLSAGWLRPVFCAVGAALFLLAAYILYFHRTDLWHLWLPTSANNDEVIYNRQLAGVLSSGQPEGVWRRDDDGIWRQDFLEGAVTAPPEMIVRGYAPSDAIALKNLGRKRLKKIFQEQALPPCLRPLWPILYDTKIKEIIWVPFLAQGPELMYYNSVTYLKVALSSTIAQRTVRSAPTSEEKER